jgi:hypothetical protein
MHSWMSLKTGRRSNDASGVREIDQVMAMCADLGKVEAAKHLITSRTINSIQKMSSWLQTSTMLSLPVKRIWRGQALSDKPPSTIKRQYCNIRLPNSKIVLASWSVSSLALTMREANANNESWVCLRYLWLAVFYFHSVRPEPVEGLLFFAKQTKDKEPFDKLRANGKSPNI